MTTVRRIPPRHELPDVDAAAMDAARAGDALVAAAIYLADVRPKVREFKSGGTSSGPYGPW